MNLKDGQPCKHRECLSHVSHPCEGCGRIGGKTIIIKRQRIVFKKQGDGYNIFLFVKGFTSGSHGQFYHDYFILGACLSNELDATIKVFMTGNHEIEVQHG